MNYSEIFHKLLERLHAIWPSCQGLLLRAWHFGRFLVQRFIEDNCLQIASSLAYTSLLSLVPLMALIFNTFSAFPMFKSVEADIQNFIFSNFVPASGEVIRSYLETFQAQTSKLTIVGIGFLIITALLMLETIDNALNRIWRSRRQRSPIRSFMVYWSILTLGPLLIGVGVFATSYLISMPWLSDVERTTWQNLLAWLPFFTTTVAFTLLYMIIPNRNVPWIPGVTGGLLAAILFEVAKKGFALYAVNTDAYQTIYGTLATIPLFLIWIYVSWVVILLGAEITYCLTIFRWEEDCCPEMHESDNSFMRAYRVVGHLWQAQCQGQGRSTENLLEQENWSDELRLRWILEKLEQARWVYRTENEQWLLARDLGENTLLDLYRLMSGGLLSNLPPHSDHWTHNLQPLLGRLNQCTIEVMNLPLKQLYRREQEKEFSQSHVGP